MFRLWETFARYRVRLSLASPCFQCQSFYYSRAYCSDDCQTNDISSPSISSSSSTRSSPYITCANGDDVPPLVPSALGSALKSYMAFNRYNVESSSASSASRSFTDDEDEAIYHFGSGSSDHDVSDGIYDGSSKSVTIPSGLSYARRPSGTNNSSTVPHPHRRIRSDSSFAPPRSVPIYSHPQADDDDYFDIGSLPEDVAGADDSDHLLSDQDWYRLKSKYQGSKPSKRSRTRASLPACFSLLQTTSSKDNGSSPVLSSSSGNTIARPSPPTPKLTSHNRLSQAQYPPAVFSTPRGRRRDVVNSRGARPTLNDSSTSGSRSGTRPLVEESPRLVEPSFYSRTDLKGSTERLVDWSSVPGFPHRGRATLRRNSSPLPKMIIGVEDPALVIGATIKNRQEDSGSRLGARTRGRARVEDFGRDSHSTDAPGFGYGRSGLLDRERCSGAQSMRFLPC
jgi:hypothetical protein